MELETQNHVATNQMKRQDEEIRRLKEERERGAQVGEGWRGTDGGIWEMQI